MLRGRRCGRTTAMRRSPRLAMRTALSCPGRATRCGTGGRLACVVLRLVPRPVRGRRGLGRARSGSCSRARVGSGACVACGVWRHDRVEERRHSGGARACACGRRGGGARRRPDLEAMGLALEGETLVAEGAFAEGLPAARRGCGDGDRERERRLRLRHDDLLLDACGVRAGRRRRAGESVVRSDDRVRAPLRHAQHLRDLPRVLCRRPDLVRSLGGGGGGARRSAREFAEIRPGMPSQATARLGELRRRQGRFAEAAELFAQVEGRRDALLGCAALALARGEAERAGELAERFLRQTPARDRAWRALGLEVLVQALARREGARGGRGALAELQSIAAAAPTDSLRARARVAGGRSRALEATWLPRAVTSRTPSISSQAAGCRSRPRTRGSTWRAPFAAREKRPPRERRRRRRGRRSRSWVRGMASRPPRGCWPVSTRRVRTEALRNPSRD